MVITTDGMHVSNTATARAMMPWGTTPACTHITLTYILSSVGPWSLVTSEQSYRIHFPPLLHMRQCSTCSQLHSCCQQCAVTSGVQWKQCAAHRLCVCIVFSPSGVTSVHVVCVNFEPVFSYCLTSPVHNPLACTWAVPAGSPAYYSHYMLLNTATVYLALPPGSQPTVGVLAWSEVSWARLATSDPYDFCPVTFVLKGYPHPIPLLL